jgi:hypothetical protein
VSFDVGQLPELPVRGHGGSIVTTVDRPPRPAAAIICASFRDLSGRSS